MVIALYTSRVVLQELGVSDYGIYMVIGGVVAMLESLSATLSGATQRYITFAIGKGDIDYLKKVFTASVKIHLYLAIIILIIAETLGLWFVNYKLNIPVGREFAANIVFQLSAISFCINIFALPYNSVVIAYEHFKFYALVDVFRSVLRLALVLCISFLPFDHLMTYGWIALVIMVLYTIAYISYVRLNQRDCTITKDVSRSLYKELLGFTGLNLLGTSSAVVYTEGSNLMLNVFWGVVLNAAMGVTNQVLNAVSTFVQNFTVAINPQITKSYAANDFNRTNNLIFFGSKIASFLLLIVGFPIVVNIHYILNLWLVEVPDYTEIFVCVALLSAFVNSFNNPFHYLMFATGNIKVYQIACIIINVCSLFFLYYAFVIHLHPAIIFVLLMIQSFLKIGVMLYLAKNATAFPVRKYIFTVYLRNFLIGGFIVAVIYIKNQYSYDMTIFALLTESILSVIIMVSIIFYIGLNNSERKVVYSIIKSRLNK